MEVQDKAQLSIEKKQATKLFEETFANANTAVDHENIKIKKVVNECFIQYANQSNKDTSFFAKNLVSEIEKIYDQYIGVLSLVPALAEVAETDKKINHKNFSSNAWVQGIRESELLKKDALKLDRHWQDKADRVKVWFRDVVRPDAEFTLYNEKKSPSLDEQKKFINHLFKKLILGKTVINDFFEEEVLRWAEDKDIVKGMVEKTIKSYEPESKQALTLHTLSLNWDDDKNFIERLFQTGSHLDPKFKELIANNTRNWEVDRLPLTDVIILEMAIAELLEFPGIPVKVSINEYIELAKNYSTPKSRQFINGILDVIAKELKENGSMKKSGRGLIDNK